MFITSFKDKTNLSYLQAVWKDTRSQRGINYFGNGFRNVSCSYFHDTDWYTVNSPHYFHFSRSCTICRLHADEYSGAKGNWMLAIFKKFIKMDVELLECFRLTYILNIYKEIIEKLHNFMFINYFLILRYKLGTYVLVAILI